MRLYDLIECPECEGEGFIRKDDGDITGCCEVCIGRGRVPRKINVTFMAKLWLAHGAAFRTRQAAEDRAEELYNEGVI